MTSVRTFHPRRGRLSSRHRDALDRLLPVYGVDIDGAPLTESRPLVLEIGSGMGEATLAMAAADAGRGYLAAEIHTPGVANLLACVEERGLTNVRVAFGDALPLLRNRIPAGTLDAVHVFFPDPWPKTRHHKRRLIQPRHVALLSSRLRPGGTLWCATDWADYAEAMVATMSADPLLLAARPGRQRPDRQRLDTQRLDTQRLDTQRLDTQRPVTKFEQRALDDGRAVHDIVYQRR